MLHQIKLVSNPSSENNGTKFSGRSHKTIFDDMNILSEISDFHLEFDVLQWLSHKSTPDRESEKNKIDNIRLRAIPTLNWVD